MNNVRILRYDWYTGMPGYGSVGEYLARQYDHLSDMVVLSHAPKLNNYYLIVTMKETEGGDVKTLEPIQLSGSFWLIPNVYTQLAQEISFQFCCKTENGDFESHSAEIRGRILPSKDHSGEALDVDPSIMFDPYKRWVEEKAMAAGAIIIDSELNSSSTNPVQNRVVKAAIDGLVDDIDAVNGRLQEKADKYTVNATFESGLYSGTPVVGETVNLTPTANSYWERAKVAVKEGDSITLHGSAYTTTKLATITDADGIVLYTTSVATPAHPVEYTMPSDGYVYMSSQKSYTHYMTIVSADGYEVIKDDAKNYTDTKVAEVSADITHLTDVIYGETETCVIANGTAPNSGNADCVCTEDYIEVTPGNTVALIINRELFDPSHYYTYGWRTYNSEKGTIYTKNISEATADANVVTIAENVAYIRFSIGEYDSNNTVVRLRKTNFAEGDVFICKDYANSIIGLPDKEEEETSGLISFNNDKVKTKCDEFAAKLKSIDKAETFLFMTDPHVMNKNNIFDDASFNRFESYMNEMKAYYSCLPFEFLLDGGDWLNNGDYKVTAMEKLGYVDAAFKSVFGPGVRKPLVGNHDTNEQGYEDAENTATASGRLSTNQLMLAWFEHERKCYYEYDGLFTRFFFLDTGSDKSDAMTTYRWEQIDWLGKALESNTKDYVVVAMHIFRNVNITQMANNVTALASAYNSRGTVTLNGITYDFTNATGIFSFVIAGHIHNDETIVQDGIPVIFTKNAGAIGDTGATFDMCVIDYAQSKIEMIRVGSGANRSISILT